MSTFSDRTRAYTAAILCIAIAWMFQARADGPINGPSAASMAAAAPVQSVNAATGNVIVPAYQRQVSTPAAVSTTDGSVSWHFPTAFVNPPACYYSLSATSTTYTFDFPVVTAATLGSLTDIALTVTAHPKQLSILSISLPINLTLTPTTVPAGTTITFTCLAPL